MIDTSSTVVKQVIIEKFGGSYVDLTIPNTSTNLNVSPTMSYAPSTKSFRNDISLYNLFNDKSIQGYLETVSKNKLLSNMMFRNYKLGEIEDRCGIRTNSDLNFIRVGFLSPIYENENTPIYVLFFKETINNIHLIINSLYHIIYNVDANVFITNSSDIDLVLHSKEVLEHYYDAWSGCLEDDVIHLLQLHEFMYRFFSYIPYLKGLMFER